ncbi:hypothetical protein BVC80_1779g45 [Macleaya cordata]|uniref:RNase H type-1 domain-containing protein n=1 Tax=Macleaya cordata TaxID=56857 RepID=A0A200QP84_MACCD|nr:hypothetical protein BVC80_1779g45 [Macleaya cordata]
MGIRVGCRPVQQLKAKDCFWFPPPPNHVLLYCDGASSGNPGQAGGGIICRNESCEVLGTLSVGLGFCYPPWGMEWAVSESFRNVWVRSDSRSAIQAFPSNRVPWVVESRWKALLASSMLVTFSHCFREVNFSADCLAKKGGSHLLLGGS